MCLIKYFSEGRNSSPHILVFALLMFLPNPASAPVEQLLAKKCVLHESTYSGQGMQLV